MEHGSFTPIILFVTGGMGPSAGIFLEEARIIDHNKAHSLLQCNNANYPIQNCLLLDLIDSTVMCLRGARFSFYKPTRAQDPINTPVDLVVNEGHFKLTT